MVLPKPLGGRAERESKMMTLGSSAGDQISRVEIHQREGTSGKEKQEIKSMHLEMKGEDRM